MAAVGPALPDQQPGTSPLETVPVEISRMIVENLREHPSDSRQDISDKLHGFISLCRASKQLNATYTPILFEHIKIDLGDFYQSYPLLRSLINNPRNRFHVRTLQIVLPNPPTCNTFSAWLRNPYPLKLENGLARLRTVHLKASTLGRAKKLAISEHLYRLGNIAYRSANQSPPAGREFETSLYNLDATMCILLLLCRRMHWVQILSRLNTMGLGDLIEMPQRTRLALRHMRPGSIPHIEIKHGVTSRQPLLRTLGDWRRWASAYTVDVKHERLGSIAVARGSHFDHVTTIDMSSLVVDTAALLVHVRAWIATLPRLSTIKISTAGATSLRHRAPWPQYLLGGQGLPNAGTLRHLAVTGWYDRSSDLAIQYLGPLLNVPNLSTLHVPLHYLFAAPAPQTDQTLVSHLPVGLSQLYMYSTLGWWDSEPLAWIYASIDLLVRTPAYAQLRSITFELWQRPHDGQAIAALAATLAQMPHTHWQMFRQGHLLVLER